MSIVEIILLCLGIALALTYLAVKIIELKKYKQLVKLGIEHGLTEEEARKNANESLSKKKIKKEKTPDVNDNDDTWED